MAWERGRPAGRRARGLRSQEPLEVGRAPPIRGSGGDSLFHARCVADNLDCMAGVIPSGFVDELLTRIDIVELINSRVPLKKSGRNHLGLCPFHDEKTPSFNVVPDKDMFHCFGCGVGGDAIEFMKRYENLSFVEAVESLAAFVGMEVPRQQSRSPQRNLRPLYDVMERAESYYRAQLKVAPDAISYLKGRGLNGIAAKEFRLGFAPDAWDGLHRAMTGGSSPIDAKVLLEAGLIGKNEKGREYDRFRRRIMFPVRDAKGRIVAFGGRLLGDGQGPKYLNSPETPIFRKNQELYGLFEARRAARQLKSLIVVEGYMDVLALAQAGIRNAVATLGTATGEGHYRKLYRYVDEVICCFDGDQAGRGAAWKALESALGSLSGGRRLRFMPLPEGEDPDSLVRQEGADGFRQRLTRATPAVEHLFVGLGEGLDLSAIDDRARLAELAKPYIDKAPPQSALRQMMRRRLQDLTGVGDGLGGPMPRAEPMPQRGPAPSLAVAGRRQRNGLPQRLLSLLLKAPQLIGQLTPEAVDALAESQQQRLFGEVVRYAAEHSDVEPAQLLGRWAGQEAHAELLELHRRPVMLAPDAMTIEFQEGAQRLLASARRRRRERLKQEMRDNPDNAMEKLAEGISALRRDSGSNHAAP